MNATEKPAVVHVGAEVPLCSARYREHFALHPDRDRRQRVTNLVRAPAFKAYLTDGRFEEPVIFVAPNGRSTLSVLVRPYGDGMKLVLSQDITERERSDAMRRDFVARGHAGTGTWGHGAHIFGSQVSALRTRVRVVRFGYGCRT